MDGERSTWEKARSARHEIRWRVAVLRENINAAVRRSRMSFRLTNLSRSKIGMSEWNTEALIDTSGHFLTAAQTLSE